MVKFSLSHSNIELHLDCQNQLIAERFFFVMKTRSTNWTNKTYIKWIIFKLSINKIYNSVLTACAKTMSNAINKALLKIPMTDTLVGHRTDCTRWMFVSVLLMTIYIYWWSIYTWTHTHTHTHTEHTIWYEIW